MTFTDVTGMVVFVSQRKPPRSFGTYDIRAESGAGQIDIIPALIDRFHPSVLLLGMPGGHTKKLTLK